MIVVSLLSTIILMEGKEKRQILESKLVIYIGFLEIIIVSLDLFFVL